MPTFYSFQQVWELRNVLHCHYVSGPPILVTENLTKTSVLSLFCFSVPWEQLTILMCRYHFSSLLSHAANTSSSFESRDGPLEDIPWVQNSLSSHLWPLLFFSVNHSELLVTSWRFSVLCCCCRQHEIDKEWHWEELKGRFSSFDASDTCSYKKGNSYHKHIAGWCRRWMIIWK